MNLDKNMMLVASEGNGLGVALSLVLLSKGAKVGIHLMDGDAVEGGYVVTELGELKMAHV